jgi:hypothetical protein
MMEQKDELLELDDAGKAMLGRIKDMVEHAYRNGYMEGIKSVVGDDEEVRVVKRLIITPSMLLAMLLIVLGGMFSLGMYIGGSNV